MERTLVADADTLAALVGLSTPVTDIRQRQTLTDAIRAAQVYVEGELGQLVTPFRYTEAGRRQSWGRGYNLAHRPVVRIVSATAETDPDTGRNLGTYTVVYLAGLDAVNDPELEPITQFVLAHAAAQPQVRVLAPLPAAARTVSSLSAEGQSVSYVNDRPAAGQPGALPDISTLDRWRRSKRRVFQRGDPAPYPYQDNSVFSGWSGWGR